PHGGDSALRSSRRFAGAPTARTVRRGVEEGASPPSVQRWTFTTGCWGGAPTRHGLTHPHYCYGNATTKITKTRRRPTSNATLRRGQEPRYVSNDDQRRTRG